METSEILAALVPILVGASPWITRKIADNKWAKKARIDAELTLAAEIGISFAEKWAAGSRKDGGSSPTGDMKLKLAKELSGAVLKRKRVKATDLELTGRIEHALLAGHAKPSEDPA